MLFSLFIMACTLAACITEDVPENSKRGNFDALWQTLDGHYCFFPEKSADYGLDWDEVRARYAPAINEAMTNEQLFEVLALMTYELRDGHVNLYAAHNTARYGRWFDDFPMNYSDTLTRRLLGRTEEFRQAGGLSYRILSDGFGYVRCASFGTLFGDGNLGEMMRYFALCPGLIVDVRSNGGGMLTSAEKLASLFIDEEMTVAYMSHKTGRDHAAISPPLPIRIAPFPGLRWQKPVAILTNRRTYSAANSFVMFLKGLPGVAVVGDRTGGGAGMPFTSELPNGWAVRFSASPMYDREGQCTETGIDPDVKTDITSEDFERGVDTIVEEARRILLREAALPARQCIGRRIEGGGRRLLPVSISMHHDLVDGRD